MKKLKLDLDDLQVESFETTVDDDPANARGTVFGYGVEGLTDQSCVVGCTNLCTYFSCNGGTCVVSCVGTCFTCANTCDTCYQPSCIPVFC